MRPPATECGTELSEAGECGHDADARHCPARRAVRQEVREGRHSLHEEIAIVEARPGRDNEHQAGFEEICSEQQARDKSDGQPPDWLTARRSARSRTSR